MDEGAAGARKRPTAFIIRGMRVSDFDFDLPGELIAQTPAEERGGSRLLVLDRASGQVAHQQVSDLPRWLHAGDLLVVNDTKVFPARLLGHRVPSGGRVEVLLMTRLDAERWDALVHPGQKLKPGARIELGDAGGAAPAVRVHGEIEGRGTFGRRTLRLWTASGDVDAAIDAIGHVPLPPYIHRDDTAVDRERYQTVYARARGSIAAPTAGLHFTPALLGAIAARGVERAAVTLHVGYGTFKPVRAEAVEDHVVDPEPYTIGADAAALINQARGEGRRVVAVGTTTVRALESAGGSGRVIAGAGAATIFLHPEGPGFQVVDALLTNFHLPRSSLFMLVCAFAGRERALEAYRQAIAARYRFYSYGDAMLIV